MSDPEAEEGEFRAGAAGDERSCFVSPQRADARPASDRTGGSLVPTQLAQIGGDGPDTRLRESGSRRQAPQGRQPRSSARNGGTDGNRGPELRGIRRTAGDGERTAASEWNRPEIPDEGAEDRGRASSRSASRNRPRTPTAQSRRRAGSAGAATPPDAEEDRQDNAQPPPDGTERYNLDRRSAERAVRAAALDQRSRRHRAAAGAADSEEEFLYVSDEDDVRGYSASVQRLCNTGGLASRSSQSRHLAAQEPPAREDVLRISSEVVSAVFGRDRAALLRVNDIPMQAKNAKDWKFRNTQQTQLLAKGMHVPPDFCPTWFFFTFQFDRDALLATSPLKVHDLEQWLWMHGRWVVADVKDMTKKSEFLTVLTQVDVLTTKLNKLAIDLLANPGFTVPQSLRDSFTQVLLRYTTIRAEFVSTIIADGLSDRGLRPLHAGMNTLGKVFAYDAASLPEFLRLVQEQIHTQSTVYDDGPQREGFISKVFLCMARAFLGGIRSGPVPAGPNPLDSPPPSFSGADAPPPPPAPPPLYGAAAPSSSVPPTAGAAGGAMAMAGAGGGFVSPPPMYHTVVQPASNAQTVALELDTIARQVAAGFREAGPLLGGQPGGGTEGYDLTPPARRVLHAMQIINGARVPGPLTSAPPAGLLPSVWSYPPPYPQSNVPFPGYVSPIWQPSTPLPTPLPSPYSTQRRDVSGGPAGGGAASGGGLHSTAQRPRAVSDELAIPYSTGLLGSFSPYRGVLLPHDLTCFVGSECPTRFARVRGEAPPGWKIDSPGVVTKNPSAWNGSDLTDAARAEYRGFITRLSLVAHSTHPVTVDEIVAATPAAPRRPLPRPAGAGRRP